jgi:4-hydroxybenzoate polyprenyltransferase
MKKYLSLVKFSHTIFALPFAFIGFYLGLIDEPTTSRGIELGFEVLLAMVFARTAAMAFNRYLDRDIDGLNPRTAGREIPSGKVSPTAALLLTFISAVLFVGVSYFINPLCFYLSPLALFIVLGYSFTKRFTSTSHFVLGLGLGLAPLGAYLAVTGEFAILPILLSILVVTWVTGFDILYALQDEDFDQQMGLKSIPVAMGARGAITLSNALHFITASVIVVVGVLFWYSDGPIKGLFGSASALFTFLLYYQHTLVQPGQYERLNIAFFTTNGLASLIYGLAFIVDFYW